MDAVWLEMYSDSDHAACPETRRSVSSAVFKLDGVVVGAFSRRQGCVSLSSGESELYSASVACAEGLGLHSLLSWMGFVVKWVLHTDSSTCKSIMTREGAGRLKHLDSRALWIQEQRRDRGLIVKKVGTKFNPADLGTKAHPVEEFLRLRALCGLVVPSGAA